MGTCRFSYHPRSGKEQHADLIPLACPTEQDDPVPFESTAFTIDNVEVHDSEFTYTANLQPPPPFRFKGHVHRFRSTGGHDVRQGLKGGFP